MRILSGILSGLFLLILVFTGTASAGISACGNVNVSDVLTQNISSAVSPCLGIIEHNVSIDMMGYSITVTASSGYNIFNNGYNGFELFNGTLIMPNLNSKGIFIPTNNLTGYANNTNIHDITQKNYGTTAGTKYIIFFSNLVSKGSTNLTFRNITNAGVFATAGTPAAIYLRGTNGVLIDNLIIHPSGVAFPIQFVTAYSNGNITITNSWLKSFGLMPGLDLGTTYVDNVRIINTTIIRDGGNYGTIFTWNHFRATNLTIADNSLPKGIVIPLNSVNVTVINSSIETRTSTAYTILSSATDISFINTNFTDSRNINVGIYPFNYSNDGTVWSNTTIDTGTFTRNITSWTNTNMTWNELTSIGTAIINYDISGLKPSTTYGFYIDGTLNTSLSTDSAGVLARLTKPNSSVNQLVSVQEIITDTSFTVTLPEGVTSIWFNATSKTQSNVNGTGQNSTVPLIQITNSGNVALDFFWALNTSTPAGVTLKADTDNDPTGATNITTTATKIVSALGAGNSQNIWHWADFSNAAPMSAARTLSVNTSQS